MTTDGLRELADEMAVKYALSEYSRECVYVNIVGGWEQGETEEALRHRAEQRAQGRQLAQVVGGRR